MSAIACHSYSRPDTLRVAQPITTNLLRALLALPMLHIDSDVEQRALDAQRQLARIGHHRLPPVDPIIAALADRNGLGVLHCDHGYDILA